jgi:ABC-type Fe3+-citrate transport system substrate-binding protein
MPIKESKLYAKTAEELDNVASGIVLHSSEPNFPTILNEQQIRADKKNLEDSRQDYEKTQAPADAKHKIYEDALKNATTKLANAQRFLIAYYGIHSQVLKDFGFQPSKTGGKKGKRTPPTT